MINERILPNPFKCEGGAELANVLDGIERELDNYQHEAMPTFLNDAFLHKLEREVLAAASKSDRLRPQALQIVGKLRRYWPQP
jgi:hypothetical protein